MFRYPSLEQYAFKTLRTPPRLEEETPCLKLGESLGLRRVSRPRTQSRHFSIFRHFDSLRLCSGACNDLSTTPKLIRRETQRDAPRQTLIIPLCLYMYRVFTFHIRRFYTYNLQKSLRPLEKAKAQLQDLFAGSASLWECGHVGQYFKGRCPTPGFKPCVSGTGPSDVGWTKCSSVIKSLEMIHAKQCTAQRPGDKPMPFARPL